MLRGDREITDPVLLDHILREAQVCRLGMADGGEPYVVPVNFACQGGSLYFHSALRGMKFEILRRNPRVCIEVDEALGIVSAESACAWGFRYRSVIGTGLAQFVYDSGEKRKALNLLMEKYSGRSAWDYPDFQLDRVCIIRIDLERVTGKQG